VSYSKFREEVNKGARQLQDRRASTVSSTKGVKSDPKYSLKCWGVLVGDLTGEAITARSLQKLEKRTTELGKTQTNKVARRSPSGGVGGKCRDTRREHGRSATLGGYYLGTILQIASYPDKKGENKVGKDGAKTGWASCGARQRIQKGSNRRYGEPLLTRKGGV